MRILAGKLKGRNFYMPAGIRPTQSILRAAIFDLLGQDMEGLSFLELYAGSGAVGLEAFSRGAVQVVLVEKDAKNARIIQENCELLGLHLGEEIRVLPEDALATVKRLSEVGKRFDIVFFDPPYGRKLGKKTLKVVNDNDILHPHSFVVAQYDAKERLEVPENLKVIAQRQYGGSIVTILQRKPHV